jgi:hypothetical protein
MARDTIVFRICAQLKTEMHVKSLCEEKNMLHKNKTDFSKRSKTRSEFAPRVPSVTPPFLHLFSLTTCMHVYKTKIDVIALQTIINVIVKLLCKIRLKLHVGFALSKPLKP